MRYRDLIKRVQKYSGLSRGESKDALQVMVESLAVHLPENERKTFAKHLPMELQSIALAVLATKTNSKEDILYQFMYLQQIDELKAKRQIRGAWQAIKDIISSGELQKITNWLPKNTLPLLG
jgi:uncharacterized protein (DUF2267 family)